MTSQRMSGPADRLAPASALASGVLLAAATGVLAGLLPALGAMRLSVVDALRRV